MTQSCFLSKNNHIWSHDSREGCQSAIFRWAEATTPVAQRSASGRALDGGPGRFLTSEHLEGASLNLLHTRDLKFHLSSLDIQVR